MFVQCPYNTLDRRWTDSDLDYPFSPALGLGLNQSIVGVPWMRDAPVVCVVPQKSQYFHYRALILSRPALPVFIPSIDKTRFETILLQNFFDALPGIEGSRRSPIRNSSHIRDSQQRIDILRRSSQYSLFPLNNDRPLNEVWVLNHELNKLSV